MAIQTQGLVWPPARTVEKLNALSNGQPYGGYVDPVVFTSLQELRDCYTPTDPHFISSSQSTIHLVLIHNTAANIPDTHPDV